ncbi:putative dsRNA-binding protein [Deinococcus aerophilus]|uniref:DRBM domain-containing protein n=1 Tax=Deinococcus aerophilus TaxID=522488 RepID=A0ABQ2GTY9_9DEIO|nr:putative dsRNA-binding protein [Deinococcus aerophilus]GGM11460.1 hypothetical protein GCM10010841_20020 [Deinococcus aerophilus]
MNAKGDLIARLLAQGRGTPVFEATVYGPPHERSFQVQVLSGGRVLGEGGQGRSKREAERLAAESALQVLDAEAGGRTDPEGAAEPPSGSVEPDRWPIYSSVLQAALETALELAPEDTTLDEVRQDAARLYRDLLEELGHGPEQA